MRERGGRLARECDSTQDVAVCSKAQKLPPVTQHDAKPSKLCQFEGFSGSAQIPPQPSAPASKGATLFPGPCCLGDAASFLSNRCLASEVEVVVFSLYSYLSRSKGACD
jgi:hypothetical protein